MSETRSESAPERCRLYLITPPEIPDLGAFADAMGEALDGGDVACVQLRLKGASDEGLLRTADRIGPLVQSRGVAFIINDRPDIAVACGADGVHVGQNDVSYEEARAAIGPNGTVGVTCHASRHLAMVAGEAGADYVAFGSFFPSSTKQDAMLAPVEVLSWWSELFTVPAVAIGGITAENCDPLVEAGADFLAVSAGVWGHAEGPRRAVEALNQAIERAMGASGPNERLSETREQV